MSDLSITIICTVVVATLLVFTALSFYRFISAMDGEEGLGVDTSFPSIDGTEGGWRMTKSLTYFLLSGMLATLATVVIVFGASSYRAKTEGELRASQTIDSLKTVITIISKTIPTGKDTTKTGSPSQNETGNE